MSSSAPVCHIPPETTLDQPSPINLPGIPPAQPNIASLVDTVNRLRQIIMIITGQQGVAGKNGKDANAKGQWTERSRITETVRVYNPNDKSQFVDVERINQLTMTNKDTKQTWTWDRNRS